MSIDLLLRALRKSSALDRGCIDAGEFEDAVKYFTLAQKLHKKIVERVERMRKSGQELYLDKIVREQEEIKFDGGDMTQQDEIEKAEREYDAAPEVPISLEQREAIIRRVVSGTAQSEIERLREENERLKEQLKEEGERVARELEGLMTAHIGRYQTAYVMQLWREGRK